MFEPILYSSSLHVLGIWCHILHPYILWIFWLIFTDILTTGFVVTTFHTFTYGLSTQRVPFNISSGAGLGVRNFFTFVCLRSYLSSYSEWCPWLTEYSWLKIFPLHHFEYIMLLPSGLQSFCCKIKWYPYVVSPVCNIYFFFTVFEILSFSLLFAIFLTMCLDMYLLGLNFLGGFCAS